MKRGIYMNFKQFSQVTNDYAVLATRKEDFSGPCHDHKDDDRNYFWVLTDGALTLPTNCPTTF